MNQIITVNQDIAKSDDLFTIRYLIEIRSRCGTDPFKPSDGKLPANC